LTRPWRESGEHRPAVESPKKFVGVAETRTKIRPQSLFGKLWPHFKPYLISITFCILLSFAVSSSGAAFPLVIKYVADSIVKKQQFAVALPLIVVLLSMLIVLDMIRFVQEFVITKVNLRLEIHLRSNLLDSLFRKKIMFVREKHSGEIISVINNDLRKVQLLPEILIKLCVELPLRLLVALGTMFFLNAILALCVMVSGPLVYILLRVVRNLRRRISQRKYESMAAIIRDFQEFLSDLRTVKLWALGPFFLRQFHRDAEFYLKQTLAEVKYNSLLRISLGVTGLIAFALAVFVALDVLGDKGGLGGNYIAFLVALWLFVKPLQRIAQAYTHLIDAVVAAERVLAYMESHEDEEADLTAGMEVGRIRSIEAQGVEIVRGDKRILENVNVKFEPGRFYVVVGPNGAGKTTLVESLFGFVDPAEGRILVNGQDMRTCNLRSLRARMSWVSQEAHLLNLSVRENVLLGQEPSGPEDQERYQWALDAALLSESLTKRGRTDEALVSEGGMNFSGGERQRLSLARALYKPHDVLVLDEANSNLTKAAFDHILQNILAGIQDRIVICVTHAEQYQRIADVIYRVAEGSVREMTAELQAV
jgi:ABC-type multidrug transport system fused ATPase/permease subunit